jgi:ABC-type nitrate/sulfonate/bicarbonate transport system substrate-binding protein
LGELAAARALRGGSLCQRAPPNIKMTLREVRMCRVAALFHRTAAAFPFAAAAAALVVGAVGAAAATMAPSAPASPLPIRATGLVPTPDPSLSYNAMAQAMGLFAKHGLVLQVGPKLGGGGPVRVQAVVTNTTDVATSDIISVLGGIYSGAPVKILMVMTPYGDEEVWGQRKYNTLKEAVGQTWAVASLGGAQRFNAQMTAEGMGLKPNAFQFVPIPGADAPRLEALDTGRTQLASISHLGAALAQAKGYAKQVHQVVAHTSNYTPPVPRIVIVARADWIKNNEAAAARYVETMLDAGRQWEAGAKAWVDPAEEIFANSGLDARQLQAAWKLFHDGGYFTINGGINYAATQKIMDLFFKLRNERPNQYLSKPSDVYDTEPLKTALDKIGVSKGTPGLPDVPDWYGSNSAAAK